MSLSVGFFPGFEGTWGEVLGSVGCNAFPQDIMIDRRHVQLKMIMLSIKQKGGHPEGLNNVLVG